MRRKGGIFKTGWSEGRNIHNDARMNLMQLLKGQRHEMQHMQHIKRAGGQGGHQQHGMLISMPDHDQAGA